MYKVGEHTDVKGEHLTALIDRVKEEFLRLPLVREKEGEPLPTSLEFVASQILSSTPDDRRLSILNELLIENHGLSLGNWGEMLKTARTPSDAFFDIIHAVVVKALRFDPALREQDNARIREAEQEAEAA